jgi:hypothetical protein
VVVVGHSNLRDGARVREPAAKEEAAKAGSGDQG